MYQCVSICTTSYYCITIIIEAMSYLNTPRKEWIQVIAVSYHHIATSSQMRGGKLGRSGSHRRAEFGGSSSQAQKIIIPPSPKNHHPPKPKDNLKTWGLLILVKRQGERLGGSKLSFRRRHSPIEKSKMETSSYGDLMMLITHVGG